MRLSLEHSGSDCLDCGERGGDEDRLCTSCPIECNRLGNTTLRNQPGKWCLEWMWNQAQLETNDDVIPECHKNCNNWQCNHDGEDCTLDQALTVCRPVMRRRAAILKAIPPNQYLRTSTGGFVTPDRAPVELAVTEMEAFRPALDEGNNQWKLEVEMKLSLRWADPRLRDVDCKRKLDKMLTVISGSTPAVRDERESDRTLIWTPSVELNGSAITYRADASNVAPGGIKNEISAATFEFTEGAAAQPWMGDGPGDGSSQCVNCAKQELKFTWAIRIVPTPKYTSYPFDRQQFTIRFDLGDKVNIFSCKHLMNDSSSLFTTLKAKKDLDSLLPTTNEYIWNDYEQEYLSASHPKGEDGSVDKGKCDITFKVRRDPSIVFLKIIVPTIITMYLGLLGCFFLVVDIAGDRAALLSVSMLINMVNLQQDYGLGKLMYAMWFDSFSISQIAISLIAIIELIIEHRLYHAGFEVEALVLQSIWSWLINLGIYPLMTLAIILSPMYPGKDGGMGAPSIACWIIMSICIFLAACEYYRRLKAGRVRREKCLDKLDKCTGQDRTEFLRLFKEAFEAFDELGAGSLHIDALRKILMAAFNKDFNQDGKMDDKEIYLKSIDEARALAGATGGMLSLEACTDMFSKLQVAGRDDVPHETHGPDVDGLTNVAHSSYGADVVSTFGGARESPPSGVVQKRKGRSMFGFGSSPVVQVQPEH